METIIAATKNKGKIAEINVIAKDLGLKVISRDEAGVPDIEIEEDGSSFEENSFKKAYAIMKLTGKPCIADDSGLEVDYLNLEPGIYSARYAGEKATDEENNNKLLKLMKGVPYEDRTARFVCVITLVWPGGNKLVARGECPGHIIDKPSGSNGFGYDPLFVPDGYDVSFGIIPEREKNMISHRAKALTKLAGMLKNN